MTEWQTVESSMFDEAQKALIAELRRQAKDLGLVVVAPYETVIYEGEGADEEYQLVPTSQIDAYQEAIKRLKDEQP